MWSREPRRYFTFSCRDTMRFSQNRRNVFVSCRGHDGISQKSAGLLFLLPGTRWK